MLQIISPQNFEHILPLSSDFNVGMEKGPVIAILEILCKIISSFLTGPLLDCLFFPHVL